MRTDSILQQDPIAETGVINVRFHYLGESGPKGEAVEPAWCELSVYDDGAHHRDRQATRPSLAFRFGYASSVAGTVRRVIRVGPAGWKYKDWNGVVYPNPKPRGFDDLAYLSEYFDAIEINTSYYGPPRPTTAKKWMDSVAGNHAFRFSAKLFHSFTHERNPAPNDEKDFKDGMAPLVEAGRFGALLMQFPWSFKSSPENREYLIGLHKRFSEYPLVVEVRHASWVNGEMLELFGELAIGICNIDQPLFHRSVKPAAHVTSSIGYVRLHGRNYKSWFSTKADVRERYDHLYSPDELDPWISRTKQIAEDAADTYVITNNHYLGKAVVNAVEISSVLRGEPAPAPPRLVQQYPQLRDFMPSDE